ncbi:YihY family inner membrane protein [Elizabethkingia argentiflava]|uniref:YihY family inner membrane protein n=1 Tax=Elizabethkingia argenteiflava TaxID=2681556 RepID=A0A845PTR1_9FLAO|nr:YhjD/YihY/BrkB family envelope integrity protein [Elizabethkingia argenteiflava]NAW50306.1 YihY family inner membrane protein [Elizabethkingia argenteiflava]
MSLKTPQFVSRLCDFLDGIHLQKLGISLLRMFEVYGERILKNPLIRQASAISWAFFISLFPFLLFLLSTLPYLPHYDKLQFYIFDVLLANILPTEIRLYVTDYLQDIFIPNLKRINNTLTIVLALVFGTNGTHTLIMGFNLNTDTKHSFFKNYGIALLITLAFVSITFLSLLGIYYVEVVMKLFNPVDSISWLVNNLSRIIGFISFPLFYCSLLSLFYWVGCIKITKFKDAMPGAVLSTLLFGGITYVFAFYVKEFTQYNIIYGSIGSFILVMIWLNINILIILFGNELNLAIKKVKVDKKMEHQALPPKR